MSITTRLKNNKKQYRAIVSYKGRQYGSAWFDKQKDAKAWEAARRTELANAEEDVTERQPVLLRTVFEDWQKHCTSKLDNSNKTFKEKVSIIERVFSDLLDKDIEEITPRMIRDDLDATGLEWRTKNKQRFILRQLMEFAVTYYGLHENPVAKVETYHEPKDAAFFLDSDDWDIELEPTYTVEEFERFVSFLPHDDYADLLIWLYWLGCRKNELISLTFSEVHEGVIRIRRTWDTSTQSFRRIKNKASIRKIKLPAPLLAIFEEHWERYSQMDGFDPKTWFVFGGYKPLSTTTLDRRKDAAIEASGLHYITIHQLRHSYASNLMAIEQNEFLVARSMGHTDTKMTKGVYAHVAVTDLTQQIEDIMKNHALH